MALLGPGWTTADGERLDRALLGLTIARLRSVLRGLDLVEGGWREFSAGPSACWLLPRATLMAHFRPKQPA